MMLSKLILPALALSVALFAGNAQAATTLTFDGLNRLSGDGWPYEPGVVGNGQYLSYTENGYVLTLHTENTPNTYYGAHIGDSGGSQTFNWHDNGNNLIGAYVTLTKQDGGSFSLLSFDYSTLWGSASASAAGYSDLTLIGGTYLPNFNNVNSVTFSSFGYHYNSLDNIVVSAAGGVGAVPEPASWALMILGFGFVAQAMRKRAVVRSQKVSFAL
jgi:hypothetical protein